MKIRLVLGCSQLNKVALTTTKSQVIFSSHLYVCPFCDGSEWHVQQNIIDQKLFSKILRYFAKKYVAKARQAGQLTTFDFQQCSVSLWKPKAFQSLMIGKTVRYFAVHSAIIQFNIFYYYTYFTVLINYAVLYYTVLYFTVLLLYSPISQSHILYCTIRYTHRHNIITLDWRLLLNDLLHSVFPNSLHNS